MLELERNSQEPWNRISTGSKCNEEFIIAHLSEGPKVGYHVHNKSSPITTSHPEEVREGEAALYFHPHQ